jgi:hypothetical protein
MKKTVEAVPHATGWNDFVVRIPKAFEDDPLSLLLDSHRSDGNKPEEIVLTMTGKLGV